MKVAVLQQFLRSLVTPLREAGASEKKANDLEETAQALEPFKDQDFGQLAAFLAQAEEFRRTGLLPHLKPGGGPRGAAGALNTAQIQHLVERIRRLEAQATEAGAPRDLAAAELDRLGLDNLNKSEAVALARELALPTRARTTAPDAVQLIRRLVLEGRQALQEPSRRQSPVDAAKIQHLAQQVRQLEERAVGADTPADVLNTELNRLALGNLSKAEALALAKEVGEQVNARTTLQQAIDLIRHTVLSRKEPLETART
jgi:hypothetical protein